MQGLTPKEEEKCKEIELKHQGEFLTGGYQKLMLLFYDKLCRANEMVDRLSDGTDRMKEKIDVLEDEPCGKRQEIHTLEEEIKGLKEDLDEEMEEGSNKDMMIEELREKLEDQKKRSLGKYVQRQMEMMPPIMVPEQLGEIITIHSTEKPIQSITIRFQEDDEEEW